TRYHNLLTTNEPPEDSDVASIHSAISAADVLLTLLDEEISHLRDRVQQLEEERNSLSRFRTQNQAVLSQRRRVPPEVLSQIFCWTLPSAKNAQLRTQFRATDSPWVLTHVCHHWRNVAISHLSRMRLCGHS
ncbi:hypothetical protein B0H19DRAFT_949729, partial [Mycena capillaripes]